MRHAAQRPRASLAVKDFSTAAGQLANRRPCLFAAFRVGFDVAIARIFVPSPHGAWTRLLIPDIPAMQFCAFADSPCVADAENFSQRSGLEEDEKGSQLSGSKTEYFPSAAAA